MCKNCNPKTVFSGYTPPPPRVALMAWVNEQGRSYYAEIVDADGETHIAWVNVPGHHYRHTVPFTALESVALCEGNTVIEAFGRPYIGKKAPAWVAFAEAV